MDNLNIAFNTFDVTRKDCKRVGRGIGSGKGVKCGKGDKGQSSRSGTSFRRLHAKFVRRFPKIGFRSKQIQMGLVTVRQISKILSIDNDCKVLHFPGRKLVGSYEILRSVDLVVAAVSKKCEAFLTKKGCNIQIQGDK